MWRQTSDEAAAVLGDHLGVVEVEVLVRIDHNEDVRRVCLSNFARQPKDITKKFAFVSGARGTDVDVVVLKAVANILQQMRIVEIHQAGVVGHTQLALRVDWEHRMVPKSLHVAWGV